MYKTRNYMYGEFRISRPTSINVSNPAFEIKRCVLYFVLSDFAPPQQNKDQWSLFGFVQRGGVSREWLSDCFWWLCSWIFSSPLCPRRWLYFCLVDFRSPQEIKQCLLYFFPTLPPGSPGGGWLRARVVVAGYSFPVMTSVILSGVVKMRDEHGMLREVRIYFWPWLLSYFQVVWKWGRYTFLVILSGGMKMRDEHGKVRGVYISGHDFCHTFRWCENEGRAWNA